MANRHGRHKSRVNPNDIPIYTGPEWREGSKFFTLNATDDIIALIALIDYAVATITGSDPLTEERLDQTTLMLFDLWNIAQESSDDRAIRKYEESSEELSRFEDEQMAKESSDAS